jgi:hypothetical protein
MGIMTSALVPMGELERMADAMASSGLFGVKTREQALALMLVAQAQGISPATACVDFDVIQGKPAMTARAMLARFQKAGGTIKWLQYADDVCEAAFTHPQCPDPIIIKWTMQDAMRAGLNGKDNWRKYPRQMLSSRVMSEGVDRCYPAASGGFYPPEVVQDFEPRKEKNITPSAGVEEQLTGEELARVAHIVAAMKNWIRQESIEDAVYEMENAGLNAEQQIVLWDNFSSKERSAMKREQARLKAAAKQFPTPSVQAGQTPFGHELPPPPELISDAAKKRLEARISETKLDRETVKQYILLAFGMQHFTELTKEEYRIVDGFVEIMTSATVEELAATWKTLKRDDQITLTAAKNARKQELEKHTQEQV